MTNFMLNVDIEDERWSQALCESEQTAEKVKNLVIERVRDDCYLLNEKTTFSVNLCLSNDERVRALNAEFRGIDAPTNVLSFANADDEEFEDILADNDLVELGDIIIAYETMERQAQELGISLHDHFCHLWAHGLLHILTYDHQTPQEAAQMEGFEADILAKMGIENPYRDEE